MKLLSTVAAVVAGLAFLVPARAADTAGSYQLNAAHDGQIKFTRAFHAPLKQKWSTDLGGNVSYPVYGGGRVFVSVEKSESVFLEALDAETGAVLWKVNTKKRSYQPAYDNGRVFTLNFDGLVQAYNAQDGSSAWSVQQDESAAFYLDPPVAHGGAVYYFSPRLDGLLSRDGATGEKRWFTFGSGSNAVPAITEDTAYVVNACHDYAFDTETGEQKWFYSTGCGGGGGGLAVYFENRFYVSDTSNHVVLDATTGRKVRKFAPWTFPPAFWTNPAGNSAGFMVDAKNQLQAFDTVTGKKPWRNRQLIETPALVVNDTVVAGVFSPTTGADVLTGFDPLTGAVLWKQDTGAAIRSPLGNAQGMGAGGNKLFLPTGTAIAAWVPKN